MKNNEKRNFRLKMNLACSKDELRPVMSFVCFDNGYMVATDAHIVIKAKVTSFSHFTDEEVEILNGKYLSSDTFKKVLACKHVVVTDEGIIDLNTKVCYVYASKEDLGGEYPNYESVLLKSELLEIDKIGIKPAIAKKLFTIISTSDFNNCVLNFRGKNKAITISHSDLLESDFTAILMPTMIS